MAAYFVVACLQPTRLNQWGKNDDGGLSVALEVMSGLVFLASSVSSVLLLRIKNWLSNLTDENSLSVADAVSVAASQARTWAIATAGFSLVAVVIAVPPLLIFVVVSAALAVPFVVMAGNLSEPNDICW